MRCIANESLAPFDGYVSSEPGAEFLAVDAKLEVGGLAEGAVRGSDELVGCGAANSACGFFVEAVEDAGLVEWRQVCRHGRDEVSQDLVYEKGRLIRDNAVLRDTLIVRCTAMIPLTIGSIQARPTPYGNVWRSFGSS